jgi:hypothetical protein
METDSTLTSSFVKELKEKYNIKEIINSRYENNDEITTFYEQYYNTLEKLEEIGGKIWKMFGDLWVAEKQTLIINILSMILLLEKEALKAKRLVLGVIRKHKNNSQIAKDKEYLLKIIDHNYKIYNSRYNSPPPPPPPPPPPEIYHNNRQKIKEDIEKEMQKLINQNKQV